TLWQREQLGDLADSDSRIAAQLGYWEQALAGMPERLVLPTDRPYPPVAELLAQVRGRSLAAFEHQDVPFEVLVERLNPTRSLTRHPLVQVLLAWQNLPGEQTTHADGFPLALG